MLVRNNDQKLKTMKSIVFVFFLALISVCSFAQEKLIPLDKNLTNVKYPFEVKFFTFRAQNQT